MCAWKPSSPHEEQGIMFPLREKTKTAVLYLSCTESFKKDWSLLPGDPKWSGMQCSPGWEPWRTGSHTLEASISPGKLFKTQFKLKVLKVKSQNISIAWGLVRNTNSPAPGGPDRWEILGVGLSKFYLTSPSVILTELWELLLWKEPFTLG